MDQVAIEVLARSMRRAIEGLPQETLPFHMRDFPRCWCTDASLLLGAFLSDKRFGGFELIRGWRGSQSHAWLAKDDLIIDITADQFPDAPLGMLITKPSSWHEQFEVEGCPEPGDFREQCGPGIDNLRILYSQLHPALFDKA